MAASEVSQLRQKITLENEAAYVGLSGLASGVSRHDFIEARMNRDLERFLQLAKEGKVEQIDQEVDFMQRELKQQENSEIVTCYTAIPQ
jgi:cytidylate kinase